MEPIDKVDQIMSIETHERDPTNRPDKYVCSSFKRQMDL